MWILIFLHWAWTRNDFHNIMNFKWEIKEHVMCFYIARIVCNVRVVEHQRLEFPKFKILPLTTRAKRVKIKRANISLYTVVSVHILLLLIQSSLINLRILQLLFECVRLSDLSFLSKYNNENAFFLMYRNVPNAMSQLRRMEAVTIWYAKTKTARLTSVGCAWDPGSLMGPHGKDNLMFDVFTKWNNPSTVVFVSVGLMV